MATPLYDAVKAYLDRDPARFHMPGHKGRPIAPVGDAARWDITEVAGADSLYEAQGAIAATEARYGALYGTKATLLSAGGSTLCIQAMLALAARPGERIICGRGCHTAAVNAMALLDLHPEWVFPEIDGQTGLAAAVTAGQVEEALARCPDAAAVYITSPSYFGVLSDIAEIAGVCRVRGVPLLVDNAHGAHLRFLQTDLHPAALGADLCCDSLHKTLPVLTGGALLHIQNERFLARAKHCMSLFGTTSPSYLIMLSADAALDYLEGEARHELDLAAKRVAQLGRMAREYGFALPRGLMDPLRLSLGYAATGLSQSAFRRHLERHGVEPEYLSERFCVFLVGGHNTTEDFARVSNVINTCRSLSGTIPSLRVELPNPPQRVAPPREALFGQSERIPVESAAGRVCAGVISPCPPGVPVAMPGEILDKYLCDSLKKYGILSVNVLK